MLRPQIAILSQTQFPTLRQNLTDENHPIHLSYGLGWGLFTTPYGKAFFKEGHDDGWENHVVCFPEKKIAILLLSNSSNADSIFKELFKTLAGDRWTPWRWEGYTPYDANVH
jgi:CubicO group peptidase (beta-lactamase class C family)